MVSQKRKLVLVTGLSTQKAYELLSNSRHDVEHFRPDILQKVLDAGDVERGDEACGLFDAADKMNALVLTAVKHGYGPGMYVHSIVGF